MRTFLFIASLFLLSFTFPAANVDTYTGREQTIGTTEDVYIFLDLPQSKTTEYTLTIRCHPDNSGTIQFAAGRAVVAGDRASIANETRCITIRSGYSNLRAKASGAGQKFTADY
jgi:hypothetical protein